MGQCLDRKFSTDADTKAKTKAKSMGSGHKVMWIDGTRERGNDGNGGDGDEVVTIDAAS